MRRRGNLVHVSRMKLLATSDLHLVPSWRSRVVKVLHGWIRDHHPDAVLIAGDLAVPAEAKTACSELRRCFPNGPIAVCLGNHDFWVGHSARESCRDLAEVVRRYWMPAVEAQQIVLLDCENGRARRINYLRRIRSLRPGIFHSRPGVQRRARRAKALPIRSSPRADPSAMARF